ncbi:MAG: metalloregulator ArsR/SmtB family transcription factor, partial [Firmicutes bacterium]|nr:metalloregulator ArsR/SmtB family transcription factor [Bacillota bacterium]
MVLEEAVALFKALGEPTRLRIVALLAEKEWCVCELVPLLGISQPAVSTHMSRLKAAGLVKERREGQWVHYALQRDALEKAREVLSDMQPILREWSEFSRWQNHPVSCRVEPGLS